jgi:ribulose-phosphate 3-epimerase
MNRLGCIEKLHDGSPQILPSMLLCDFAELRDEIRRLEKAGYNALHLDVMDGVFVPNFTYGMTIVEAVRKCTELILDVHLMMVHPEKYLVQFRQAGADVITIHAEAADHPDRLLNEIRNLDAVAGIAINPSTPVDRIQNCLPYADLVLVMSVDAGFGAQSFNHGVLPKFAQLKNLADSNRVLLQIDGGVNQSTIASARRAGAQLFVVGSAIFRTDDYLDVRKKLAAELDGVHERN